MGFFITGHRKSSSWFWSAAIKMEDNKRMMTVLRSSLVFPVFTASVVVQWMASCVTRVVISNTLNVDFKNQIKLFTISSNISDNRWTVFHGHSYENASCAALVWPYCQVSETNGEYWSETDGRSGGDSPVPSTPRRTVNLEGLVKLHHLLLWIPLLIAAATKPNLSLTEDCIASSRHLPRLVIAAPYVVVEPNGMVGSCQPDTPRQITSLSVGSYYYPGMDLLPAHSSCPASNYVCDSQPYRSRSLHFGIELWNCVIPCWSFMQVRQDKSIGRIFFFFFCMDSQIDCWWAKSQGCRQHCNMSLQISFRFPAICGRVN